MVDQELRKLLEQIHHEIENTETVDDQSQELLRDLGKDIGKLLDRSEASRIQLQPSFIKKLEDSIDYFEITHPVLTAMITKVLDTLGGAGI
jgi:hypothetical protein